MHCQQYSFLIAYFIQIFNFLAYSFVMIVIQVLEAKVFRMVFECNPYHCTRFSFFPNRKQIPIMSESDSVRFFDSSFSISFLMSEFQLYFAIERSSEFHATERLCNTSNVIIKSVGIVNVSTRKPFPFADARIDSLIEMQKKS